MIKGSKMSEKQKLKIAKSLIGHTVSKETRTKISKKSKGKHPLSEFKKGHPKPNNAYSFLPREKHPNWKGGGNTYLSKLAKAVYSEFHTNKLCEKCGNSYEIVIHHKDENRKNNKISNLKALCRVCHISLHKKGKKK